MRKGEKKKCERETGIVRKREIGKREKEKDIGKSEKERDW